MFFPLYEKEKSPGKLPLSEGVNSFNFPLFRPVCDNDYTTFFCECQAPLGEKEEISDIFTPKRKNSLLLADSFYRLGIYARADRVHDCGSFLEFRQEIDGSGVLSEKSKLYLANFCRDRLCPMCTWRRSLKIYGQLSRIFDNMPDNVKYLFLTLTVPNVPGADLSSRLDLMYKAWNDMHRRKELRFALGFVSVLEITRNDKTGMYHPHFHIVIAVDRSYGSRYGVYLPQAEFLRLWRECTGIPEITQVNIRLVRPQVRNGDSVGSDLSGDLSSAVREVAKYATKDKDFLFVNHKKTDEIVLTLSRALHGRRLFNCSGIFSRIRKKLLLDDPEDGDLVAVDGSDLSPAVAYLVRVYKWGCGAYSIVSSAEFLSSLGS